MIEITITTLWHNGIQIKEFLPLHNCKLVTTKSVDRQKLSLVMIIKGNIKDIVNLSNTIGSKQILVTCTGYVVTPHSKN